jgi:biopolymer transport protein ExbB
MANRARGWYNEEKNARIPSLKAASMDAFWHFLTQDWYFAIPMLGMSLAAVTLVVWRLLLNMGARTNLNRFLPAFQEKLQKEGVESALKFCQTQPGMIPRRLFPAGLETSKQGLAAMRRAMATVIELEIVPQLNFLLPTILAIAKIATMVGLLGTVISMIGTFNKISQPGSNAQSQASSIGLALFATALGLVTAIPLVFTHVLFKAWIADFEIKMKSAAHKLVLLMQASKPAPATAKPKPETAITQR